MFVNTSSVENINNKKEENLLAAILSGSELNKQNKYSLKVFTGMATKHMYKAYFSENYKEF